MPITASNPIVNVPIVTLFDDVDHVDCDALARNVERWLTTPATAFLVGSRAGEEWCLCRILPTPCSEQVPVGNCTLSKNGENLTQPLE